MRQYKAIVRNSLRKSGGKGTGASTATGLAMLCFGLALLSSIIGMYYWWWMTYYWHRYQPTRVIIVNAPETWMEYINETDTSYKFYYREHEYVFDIAQFNEWMEDKHAFLTVVFPPPGNEEERMDVRTFYPINSLDNKDRRDTFVEKCLDGYQNYLLKTSGVSIAVNSPVFTDTDSVLPSGKERSDNGFTTAATGLIPLLFFIVILYAAMSSGTTAISSAKEQGTFAGILMTPVKRSTIVFGHVTAVWIKTLIPAAVLMIPLFIIGMYRPGALPTFILMATMALFVASLTVMISVMNHSVVSAQTTFLPIFLVFIVLCVTCMQSAESFDRFYYMMPLYGQFLGTGALLTGVSGADLINASVSGLITLMLTAVCIYVTIRMLSLEKFTVTVTSSTDKDLRRSVALEARARRRAAFRPKACIFGYKPKRFIPAGAFISGQLLRPLGLLAIFQMLALLPPLFLTGGSGLTKILMSLKDVATVDDVLESSEAIIGVFMSTPSFLISMGIGYILIIAVYVLHVKYVERRSLSTIGLPIDSKSILHYLAGIPLGLGMMGMVFLILIATGNIEITDTGIKSSDIPLLLAYFFMWFPQGATEEIMFRGYMMSRTAARFGLIPAVAVSSLLFCLFHGLNPGFTPLALVNLVLISILFALIALRTGKIWTLCAAHTMWNLTQGNILGLEVSGNSGGVAFITSRATSDSSAVDLWTGGTFGPEGGLAVTIVVVTAISVVLLVTRNKGRKA